MRVGEQGLLLHKYQQQEVLLQHQAPKDRPRHMSWGRTSRGSPWHRSLRAKDPEKQGQRRAGSHPACTTSGLSQTWRTHPCHKP